MKLILALATVAALASGSALAEDMTSMAMPGASSAATKEYMQAMQSMQEAMKGMKPTNDPNKDFVMMMLPHHQAAVEMARSYLKYGSDPMLKKMANDIVRSQNKEISEMSAWQAKHRE